MPEQDSASYHSLQSVRPPVMALKNNLLYDAVLTPNIQLEFRLNDHWSLQAGVGFNPFPIDDVVIPKWRHLSVDLAPRYWFCRTFSRDFVSFNLAYAHYNVAGGMYPVGWLYKPVQSNRFQGDALMAGVSYGWSRTISQHFSIELEGGVDGGWTRYDKFACAHCGKLLAQEHKWFVVPRLGVNLVVLLGGDEQAYEDRCDCHKLAQNNAGQQADEPSAVEQEQPITDNPAVSDTTQVDYPTIEIQSAPDTLSQPSEPDTPHLVSPRDADMLLSIAQKQDSLREVLRSIEDGTPTGATRIQVADLVEQQTELAHLDQMARLRELVLRPLDEFDYYDPEERVTREPNSIFMHFDVDESGIDRTFIHNDELLDSIMQVIDQALHDQSIRISLIRIVGMASFDGPINANERLSYNRARALKQYIQQRFAFDESIYRIYNGGECWQELRWYLEQESFPGKREVMRIIDTEPDFEKREAQIKKLRKGQTYAYMRTHFKRYLRNLGTITVYYEPR